MSENILEIQQLKEENEKLKEENEKLKEENEKLKEHLKKYTAPKRAKKFYDEHKEEIKLYKKEYTKEHKVDPIKKAEYNKEYYKRKKELEPKCTSCNLFNIKNTDILLCNYCDPNGKIQDTKEIKVVKFLETNNIKFTHNKSIGFECGNYRPDILIDCNTHFIVVEVDENQHENYNKNCEMARMNNIYVALGLPVIFLRYNPDLYYLNNKLKKTKDDERLNLLFERIRYYENYDLFIEPLMIEKLYYNNDNNIFFEKINFELNLEKD